MTETNGISNQDSVSATFFAAKDAPGITMVVPKHSGLKEANILRVDGLKAFAMKDENVLPIDFPDLTPAIRDKLMELKARERKLPVSEFTARGLLDAYRLELVIT